MFTICKAKDDGYYVTTIPAPAALGEILFCGSLTDCLQYVWTAFGQQGSIPS